MLLKDLQAANQREQNLIAKVQKYERDIDIIKFEAKSEQQKANQKLLERHSDLESKLLEYKT